MGLSNGTDALIDDSKLSLMEDENSKSVLQTKVAQFYTDQLAMVTTASRMFDQHYGKHLKREGFGFKDS